MFVLLFVVALLLGSAVVTAQEPVSPAPTPPTPVEEPEPQMLATAAAMQVVVNDLVIRTLPDRTANVVGELMIGDYVVALAMFEAPDNINWVFGRMYSSNDEYIATAWAADGLRDQKYLVEKPVNEAERALAVEEVEAMLVPECGLEDHGVQVEIPVRFTAEQWVFDLWSTGCNILVEGRQTLVEEHHIWILRQGGEINTHDTDFFNLFTGREFSVWLYPTNWNMDGFDATKPPIAAEFVEAKFRNMADNSYSWPIFVHPVAGDTYRFDAVDSQAYLLDVELPNNCDSDVPDRLEITGIYNPATKVFDASIGAENCVTVAFIDSATTPTTWTGAQDNVSFLSIEAWLMPSTWEEAQIEQWVQAYVAEE